MAGRAHPEGHKPTITRVPVPGGNRNRVHCRIDCECGWAWTVRLQPARGGVGAARAHYWDHVDPPRPELTFHDWLEAGIRHGWVTPTVDRAAEELSMIMVVRVPHA